jgi:NTP pyrophosphatase (non-canonical NTP hydrolase)
MPNLKNSPSLSDFQGYVAELEEERGFSGESAIQKCLMLGEEVGELFKAVRKADKSMKTDANSDIGEIPGELSDILIFVFSIANRYGVDLEKAFREKEDRNKNRTWK